MNWVADVWITEKIMNYHPQSYSGDSPSSGFELLPSQKGLIRSSDVVKEAKQWSEWKARSTAMTKRPFTPRDYDRRLFGQTGNPSSSRPPSAISISSRLFDPTDPDSRPGSAALHPMKLTPLPQTPALPENLDPPVSPKYPVPPSFDKKDISARHSSKSRLPRKVTSNAGVPMKAFHMAGIGVSHTKNVVDSEEIHRTRYEAEKSSEASELDCASKLPSTSKTNLNIDLMNLYAMPNEEKSHDLQEKQSSAYSSSSSSGSYSEPSQIRSRDKSSGSSGGSKEETADQAKYWNQNILPLMEALEDVTQSQEDVCRICKKLHHMLKEGGCLNNLLGRRRTSLLSILFKQLNSFSSSSHLICAKIILDLGVRRQNLNSLCKMLYKISREKKFDEEYVENELIESMIAVISNFSDPLENYETLVYLTGTIKFLSDNKIVAKDLIAKECPQCFIILLADVMASLKERKYLKKEKLHATDILIQITAVVRSISDVDRKSFIDVNLFCLLIEALDVLAKDESLTLNISRIISKFTMYDEIFPELLSHPSWASAILNAVVIHKKCLNIVIRLYFALGNLTAKEEEARLTLHKANLRPSSASKIPHHDMSYISLTNSVLEVFVEALKAYDDTDQKQVGDRDKCLDTINKIIRVVANMAISEIPGRAIACNDHCVTNIVKILCTVSSSDSEELVINTLTALNNFSYYNDGKTAISNNRVEISNVLIRVLMNGSMPCIMEAVRVFGNLSRYDDIPPLLHSKKIDLMMVTLLDSKTWQMVYSACGVLINVSVKHLNRKCLIKEGIISKLVDVLKHFAPGEWHVCGVACQLLWNLCDNNGLSSEEADSIMQVLHEYLKENAPLHLLASSEYDKEFIQCIVECWKTDFYPVAIRLYRKISSQHSQLQPL